MQIIVKELKMRFIQHQLETVAANIAAKPVAIDLGKCQGQLPEQIMALATELQNFGTALSQVVESSAKKVDLAATQYVAADESLVI